MSEKILTSLKYIFWNVPKNKKIINNNYAKFHLIMFVLWNNKKFIIEKEKTSDYNNGRNKKRTQNHQNAGKECEKVGQAGRVPDGGIKL